MNNYPPLTCHFMVEWGGTRTSFSEVSGLTIEHSVVEFREGASSKYGMQKMPGLPKYNNIILKRVIIAGDNEFYDWINTVQLNTVERRDLIIKLLNEQHEPIMVWKVKDAWPTKLESPVLNAAANEASMESLEIVHEGLAIESL